MQKIKFNQYITKRTQKLLEEARKLQQHHNIAFIWQDRGTVLIRLEKNSKQIFKIKSTEDLEKFITTKLNKII